jgi:histidinol dehydrogenase
MGTFSVYRLREIPQETKERIMKRSRVDVSIVHDEVRRILDDVKTRGDEAIAEFLSKQTGKSVSATDLRVDESDVKNAYGELDADFVRVLKHFISNVKKFHKMQMPTSFMKKIEEGIYAGQIVVPLDSAGLYVPSGKARYPSVSGMITTAAKVAGVKRIALACPPQGDELKIDPATLVAAHLAGANEFHIMGGAHAIAAFAYGTRLVKPVEAIAGPGGPYTYAAKRMVGDLVRLDLPAGPSEGMVFSDGTVSSTQVALDVLNEAEHGPDSSGILVTTSYDFGLNVAAQIDKILDELPEPRRGFVKQNAKKYSGIIVCDTLEEAIRFINEFSPEHLAIDSKRARRILNKYRLVLRNFGTVCINTPISAGNFGIGPNSTLPTGGYARMFSGLSVDAFLKKPTIEELRGKGWRKFAEMVITLADYEGFPSHARAMKSYLNNN